MLSEKLVAFDRYVTKLSQILFIAFPLILLTGRAPVDIGIAFIATGFLLHCALTHSWMWLRVPWIQGLLLLWGYIVLRSFFAEDPSQALRRALPFIRYLVFAAALAFWIAQDESTRQRFLTVLGAVILFLCIDGLVQKSTGTSLSGHAIHIQPGGNERLTGPFGSIFSRPPSPVLGIMLVWLAFPALLSTLLSPNGALRPISHLLYGGMLLLLSTSVIALSGERTALMFFLIGWGILLFLLPIPRGYLLFAFCAKLVFLGLLAASNPMMLERQFVSLYHSLAEFNHTHYGSLLRANLELMRYHPWFGVGTNHYASFCESIFASRGVNLPSYCATHPHNVYFELLIENGIVGLVLYLAFIVSVCRACWIVWPSARMHPVFLGALVICFLRIWPLAPSAGMFSPWASPPFWLMLGLLLSFYQPSKNV